jgi:hypothetical protein
MCNLGLFAWHVQSPEFNLQYWKKKCNFFVLIFSGCCYNKPPQTRWLVNNKLISHSSEGWEVQAQGTNRFIFWGGPLSGWWMSTFPCILTGCRELSWAPFIRALIPLMRTVPLRPTHLPKALLPDTISMGVMNLWEGTQTFRL